MNNISTSGPIDLQFIHEDEIRTFYEDLPALGFNCLVKTRRQGRWFVLKGLKPEFRGQAVYLEFLKKEYALMVQLDHPNVVKAYAKEVNEAWGPCIVMEYIDGVRLDDFLASRPTLAARRKVADQLADALAYIHSKQILHRDLKPGNILVTRNGGNVKIIDFGLSDADDYAILKQSAGTPEYMSPEQRTNQAVDCKSDIYAFGIILRKIFPHRYRAIVRRCANPDRDRRFDNMEAVREAIIRSERRRRFLPYVGLLAVLVLGILLPIRPKADRIGSAFPEETMMPDQKAYLQKAFWLIDSQIQDLMREADKGSGYKEILQARLANQNHFLSAKRAEMSTLYTPGSPEQMRFISEFNRELDAQVLQAVSIIDKKCLSFEECYRKGIISQGEYKTLKWTVAPTVTTPPVTDITATSAVMGGVKFQVKSLPKTSGRVSAGALPTIPRLQARIRPWPIPGRSESSWTV